MSHPVPSARLPRVTVLAELTYQLLADITKPTRLVLLTIHSCRGTEQELCVDLADITKPVSQFKVAEMKTSTAAVPVPEVDA